MERKGLCMYSLRNLDNLDQSTLSVSLCYRGSKENSINSYEQLRFMIPHMALTVV